MEEVCKNVKPACFLHEGERNLQRSTFREKEDGQFSLTFFYIGCARIN